MKKFSLRRFFPPGWKYIADLVIVIIIGLLLFSIDIETRFSRQFRVTLREVTVFHRADRMPEFNYFIGSAFGSYVFFLLICIIWAIILRMYFSHNRSIYIMKRLNSGRELFLRTAAVPLVVAVMGLVICIAAILLMHRHYLTATPPEYLPPDEPIEFFRAFIPWFWRGILR